MALVIKAVARKKTSESWETLLPPIDVVMDTNRAGVMVTMLLTVAVGVEALAPVVVVELSVTVATIV